jgi:hypothetical protein
VRFVAGTGVSGEFPARIEIMSDDGLSDRRRASEEEYFRKRDQQLVEHLRIQAEREAARGRLSQRVGVADDEVLQDLETLGFSDQTVSLLPMVPLVHVGWADGGMAASAAQRIMEASREHGIEELSDAGRQLRNGSRADHPSIFSTARFKRLGRYSSTRASASQSSTFATCSHNLPTSLRLQAGYSDSERFRRTNGQSWTALVANWNLPGPD